MIIQHICNAAQVLPFERRASNDASISAVDSPPTSNQLKKAGNDTNHVLIQLRQNVKFQFSMSTQTHTKKRLIKVVNTESGELIRQMPFGK